MLIETILNQYDSWQLTEPLLAPPEIVTHLTRGTTHRAVKVCGPTASGSRCFVIRYASRDPATLAMPPEHERRVMQQAYSMGLAPRLVHWYDNARVTVSEFIDGHMDTPEPALLGQTLRRIHGLPIKADPISLSNHLQRYTSHAIERGVAPEQLIDPNFEPLARAISLLESSAPVLCHNDLGRGNLIITGEQAVVIDWEYAAMGNRYFDLAAATAGWPELDPGAVIAAAIPRDFSPMEWQAALGVYAALEWNWYQASGLPMPEHLSADALVERLNSLP